MFKTLFENHTLEIFNNFKNVNRIMLRIYIYIYINYIILKLFESINI